LIETIMCTVFQVRMFVLLSLLNKHNINQ